MEQDCKWVELIRCMRISGLPIEVPIEYLGLFQQGDATIEARKTLFVTQRKLLLERMA